jgi:hypothetical protein
VLIFGAEHTHLPMDVESCGTAFRNSSETFKEQVLLVNPSSDGGK